MISRLLKGDEKFLDKLVALEHCEEVITKKMVVWELLLRGAKDPTQAEEKTSIVPLFCESYFMLGRLQGLLSRLIIEHADKARIKLREEDQMIYESYFLSLEDLSKRLRFEHSVMLSPVKNVS
jgi:hypothetical protein